MECCGGEGVDLEILRSMKNGVSFSFKCHVRERLFYLKVIILEVKNCSFFVKLLSFIVCEIKYVQLYRCTSFFQIE